MKREILRRNLLKWAGFLAADLALPKSIGAQSPQEQEPLPVVQPQEKPLPKLDSEAYKPAVCKLCPALCMLQIRVVNGKPVGVSGLPGHPVNQGTICPKGNTILQELYHPDRLTSPLRQKGARGSGQWQKISWDEAHQMLRLKLSELMKRNQPEALAILAAPIRDIRHEIQKRFAEVFGTPNFWEWGWSLGEHPLEAFKAMHGSSEGLFYDLMNANLIVSFGWDWLQAFPSPVEAQRAYSELRRGRIERRARIVQVEPRLSITASKADEWISIKPDTEGILALGVAQVLIKEGIFDKGFVDQWTNGFEEFKKLVFEEFNPDRVSQLTDIKVNQIQQIAHEMAFVKPSLAISHRGRLFNQVAVHSLNVLVGSIGVRQGILSTEAEKYQLTLPAVSNLKPKSKVQAFASLHQIPETIIASGKSPIEVFWMERVNPVFLSPQPERWKKALEKIPFVVSFSSFLDESSQLADLVLPPHTSLEAWQYGFSSNLKGSGVISFAPPVIGPFYETGDHGDFILNLAKSLGGEMAQSLPWANFLESLQTAVSQAKAEEPMRKGGWWEYEATEANLQATLKTESGKLEFPMEILKKSGRRGVQLNAPTTKKSESYPLHLYVHVPLAFSFGEGAHLPYLHSVAGAQVGEEWETWVEIHPLTAEKLGIKDRQMVWVESSIGKIKARARHYEGIRQDVISIPFGLGHTAMGRYANGIGSNPAEILKREVDVSSSQLLWQVTRVKIYGV